ncbi:MAG: hypothetical protein H7Y31_08135 [Chitinophagaceae bacterium]|nr:hypothetical protein [Chitinophagaceae bacterium]
MIVIKGNNGSGFLLHHNCILSLVGSEVMGIVLGNCVYGKSGLLKGKLLNRALYNTKGQKLAVEKLDEQKLPAIDHARLTEENWRVLNSIQDHNSPWVEPKEEWAESTLQEFFVS